MYTGHQKDSMVNTNMKKTWENKKIFISILGISFIGFAILGVLFSKTLKATWNPLWVGTIYGVFGAWVTSALYTGVFYVLNFLKTKTNFIKVLAIFFLPLTWTLICCVGLVMVIVEIFRLLTYKKYINEKVEEDIQEQDEFYEMEESVQEQTELYDWVNAFFEKKHRDATIACSILLFFNLGVAMLMPNTENVNYIWGTSLLISTVIGMCIGVRKNHKTEAKITDILYEDCDVEKFQKIAEIISGKKIGKGWKEQYKSQYVLTKLLLDQKIPEEYFAKIREKVYRKQHCLNLAIWSIKQNKYEDIRKYKYLRVLDSADAKLLTLWMIYKAEGKSRKLFKEISKAEGIFLKTIQKVYFEYLKIQAGYYENNIQELETSKEYIIRKGGTLPIVKELVGNKTEDRNEGGICSDVLFPATNSTKWNFMKKKKLIMKISIILITIVILLGTIIFGSRHIEENRNIRDEVTMMGSVALMTLEGSQYENFGRERLSFDTLESVIDFYFQDNLARKGDEIIRFEDGDYFLIVFSGDIKDFLSKEPGIFLFLIEKDSNANYYLLRHWVQGIRGLSYNPRGRWQDEDRVARDIVLSYVQGENTSKINKGMPLYYGVGMGRPPQQLSILGHSPDVMFLFESGGEDYFFWYYYSKGQVGQLLQQNIDIHSFTMAEIINLLDISIVR